MIGENWSGQQDSNLHQPAGIVEAILSGRPFRPVLVPELLANFQPEGAAILRVACARGRHDRPRPKPRPKPLPWTRNAAGIGLVLTIAGPPALVGLLLGWGGV